MAPHIDLDLPDIDYSKMVIDVVNPRLASFPTGGLMAITILWMQLAGVWLLTYFNRSNSIRLEYGYQDYSMVYVGVNVNRRLCATYQQPVGSKPEGVYCLATGAASCNEYDCMGKKPMYSDETGSGEEKEWEFTCNATVPCHDPRNSRETIAVAYADAMSWSQALSNAFALLSVMEIIATCVVLVIYFTRTRGIGWFCNSSHIREIQEIAMEAEPKKAPSAASSGVELHTKV